MTVSVPPAGLTDAAPAWPGAGTLKVALVNNMPDAALRATERQFRDLIARSGQAVELAVHYIPETPRSELGALHCRDHYRPLDDLLAGRADAVIVTGCEPKAGSLRDEPFWPAFTRLVDWARANTVSTLFSCLAAHAAVLHLDGIERRRLPRKLSGVYPCERVATHPLVAGADRSLVPHSRYNAVPEAALTEAGYAILTRSDAVGADLFVKRWPSLFVFVQGHPEYEPDTLAREFRRDVERCLAGTADGIPTPPENYFAWPASDEAETFEAMPAAFRIRSLQALASQLGPQASGQASWQADAAALYRNWLGLVAQQVAQAAAQKGTLRDPLAEPPAANDPLHRAAEPLKRDRKAALRRSA